MRLLRQPLADRLGRGRALGLLWPPRSRCCRSCPTLRSRPRPGSASAWASRSSASPRSPSRCSRWRARSASCGWQSHRRPRSRSSTKARSSAAASALIERFERRAPLAVAVFTSAGCSLCAALEPSLRLLARDPEVELQLFDEHDDAEAWESLAVPGSPYAVVLAPDGEVLAKGTFNSLYQLESLLGPAVARA